MNPSEDYCFVVLQDSPRQEAQITKAPDQHIQQSHQASSNQSSEGNEASHTLHESSEESEEEPEELPEEPDYPEPKLSGSPSSSTVQEFLAFSPPV